MAEYARVEGNQVVEIRDLDSFPSHRATLWKTVERSGSGDVVTTEIDGNVVRIIRSERPLVDIKADLKRRVDFDAEQTRLKYITPGHGMALTYQEKHKQAEAVDDLGELAANALTEAERNAQFPTLSASVGIEAATLWACAQLVIECYEQFDGLAHQIEKARLQGKKNISDASDAAAARAAYEAITWPV